MAEPSRKLSTEEVNALMEGLKSGDLSASTSVKDGKEFEYKTFNFGSDDLSLLGDYYALRLINERFARMVRSVFLPLLRVQPRISSFPPEVKSFEELAKIGKDSIYRLLSPLLYIFFAVPNGKKFKAEIHQKMKNCEIDKLESVFLQFVG